MGEILGPVYDTATVVFRQGDPADAMYVIQSGAVEVSCREGDRETVVAVMEKGDFFGEFALLSREVRAVTVTATRPSRLLPLTRASLLDRVRSDPGVALHLIEGMIARIQRLRRQILASLEEDRPFDDPMGEGPARAAAAAGPLPHAAPDPEPAPAPSGALELSAVWKVSPDALEVPASETVFRQGDPGDAVFLIAGGVVEIRDQSGRRLARLGAGEVFGETAVITNVARTATAVAVERAQLIRIPREVFFDRVRERPELALHLLLTLVRRERDQYATLASPGLTLEVARQSWSPLLRAARTRVALVSLSTCAGCGAVLLDQEVLAQVGELADIVYCPMLLDEPDVPEVVDVAFVDGIVRLREDEEKLRETRRRSRCLVAWGTCSTLGGIPTNANRFEVEELIADTFSRAEDPFAYYLSGRKGVDPSTTYLEGETALLRRARPAGEVVKVDYHVPGCPPQASHLLEVLRELTGVSAPQPKAVVCAECGRKIVKPEPGPSLRPFPSPGVAGGEPVCFNSSAVPCLGFLVRGGCGAACPRHGLPCWGCRGPSKAALKRTAEGEVFEEVVVEGLSRRCGVEPALARPFVRDLRRRGHGLLDVDPGALSATARVR